MSLTMNLCCLVPVVFMLTLNLVLVNSDEIFDGISRIIMNRVMKNDEIELALDMAKMKIDGLIKKANLSLPCAQFRRLFQNELEKGSFWTFQLLDAQAKPPPGFMRGKTRMLGSYDQCLEFNVNLEKFRAKYNALPDTVSARFCHLRIPISRMISRIPPELLQNFKSESYEVGNLRSLVSVDIADSLDPDINICIPSVCTNDDIMKLIGAVKGAIQVGKIIPTEVDHCDDGSVKPLNRLEIFIIIILSFLIWLVIFGTLMDWYHGRYQMKPRFRLIGISLYFSILRNGKTLFDTDNAVNEISCLHGLKSISMFFIFLGHLGLALMGTFSVDAMELDRRAKEFWTQFVVNAAAWVDTFFVISGLLVSYHILDKAGSNSKQFTGKTRREQICLTIKYLFSAYLYRYLRLAVPMIAVLLLTIIWQRFGHGPYWYLWEDELVATCRRDWWKLLTFIHNFFDQNMIGFHCLGPTWYIANDFQFYLIAPFITMLILAKRRWISWAILATLTVSSMIITGLIIDWKDLTPTVIWHPKMINGYYSNIYIKPWCRIGAYCIGLALGDILQETKRNFKIRKLINIPLWFVSIITLSIVLFMPYRYNRYGYTHVEAILFGSLHRPIWALACSWMIFSMVTGNAPIMNKILSWPFFIILSRLTYGAYLIQFTVYSHFMISNSLYLNASTHLGAVLFCGFYMIGYMLALILALVVEYPTKSMLEDWQRSRLGPKVSPPRQTNGLQGDVKLTAINSSQEGDKVAAL